MLKIELKNKNFKRKPASLYSLVTVQLSSTVIPGSPVWILALKFVKKIVTSCGARLGAICTDLPGLILIFLLSFVHSGFKDSISDVCGVLAKLLVLLPG